MVAKKARFAGARLVMLFAVEDEDGDVENMSTEPLLISAKEWRAAWFTPSSGEVIARAIAQIETPPAADPTNNGNGTNRQQKRAATRKRKTTGARKR